MKTQSQPSALPAHTPGPWTAYGCTVAIADVWREGQKTEGRFIACSAPRDEDEMPSNEDLDNARLIAACPRMFDFVAKMAATGDCPEAQSIIDSLR